MPEGPECRTISNDLLQRLYLRKIISLEALNGYEKDFTKEYSKVKGFTIQSVLCKGKLIYFTLTQGDKTLYLLNHLNMTGH